MKKFKDEQQMLDFISGQLNFEPNISIVLEEPYMEYILDDKVDFETITFSKEKNSDYYTYLINKIENEDGDISLFIKPIEFNEEEILETKIENDIIIVQEGLLDNEDIKNIINYDELIKRHALSWLQS